MFWGILFDQESSMLACEWTLGLASPRWASVLVPPVLNWSHTGELCLVGSLSWASICIRISSSSASDSSEESLKGSASFSSSHRSTTASFYNSWWQALTSLHLFFGNPYCVTIRFWHRHTFYSYVRYTYYPKRTKICFTQSLTMSDLNFIGFSSLWFSIAFWKVSAHLVARSSVVWVLFNPCGDAIPRFRSNGNVGSLLKT